MSVANVEDAAFTQGQEAGGQGGKTRGNWVLKVGRAAVKGKDVGEHYLKGKPDPGLAPPVLWDGCTPTATELEDPKSIQCRACGMGTGEHSPKSGWEMAGNTLGGACLPTGDFPSTRGTATASLSKKQEPGCAQAAALEELCQEPGGKGELELRAGWSWRNIIGKNTVKPKCVAG